MSFFQQQPPSSCGFPPQNLQFDKLWCVECDPNDSTTTAVAYHTVTALDAFKQTSLEMYHWEEYQRRMTGGASSIFQQTPMAMEQHQQSLAAAENLKNMKNPGSRVNCLPRRPLGSVPTNTRSIADKIIASSGDVAISENPATRLEEARRKRAANAELFQKQRAESAAQLKAMQRAGVAPAQGENIVVLAKAPPPPSGFRIPPQPQPQQPTSAFGGLGVPGNPGTPRPPSKFHCNGLLSSAPPTAPSAPAPANRFGWNRQPPPAPTSQNADRSALEEMGQSSSSSQWGSIPTRGPTSLNFNNVDLMSSPFGAHSSGASSATTVFGSTNPSQASGSVPRITVTPNSPQAPQFPWGNTNGCSSASPFGSPTLPLLKANQADATDAWSFGNGGSVGPSAQPFGLQAQQQPPPAAMGFGFNPPSSPCITSQGFSFGQPCGVSSSGFTFGTTSNSGPGFGFGSSATTTSSPAAVPSMFGGSYGGCAPPQAKQCFQVFCDDPAQQPRSQTIEQQQQNVITDISALVHGDPFGNGAFFQAAASQQRQLMSPSSSSKSSRRTPLKYKAKCPSPLSASVVVRRPTTAPSLTLMGGGVGLHWDKTKQPEGHKSLLTCYLQNKKRSAASTSWATVECSSEDPQIRQPFRKLARVNGADLDREIQESLADKVHRQLRLTSNGPVAKTQKL